MAQLVASLPIELGNAGSIPGPTTLQFFGCDKNFLISEGSIGGNELK